MTMDEEALRFKVSNASGNKLDVQVTPEIYALPEAFEDP